MELLLQLGSRLACRVECGICADQLLEQIWYAILCQDLHENANSFTRLSVNDAAWISICLVVVVVINMLGAGQSQS